MGVSLEEEHDSTNTRRKHSLHQQSSSYRRIVQKRSLKIAGLAVALAAILALAAYYGNYFIRRSHNPQEESAQNQKAKEIAPPESLFSLSEILETKRRTTSFTMTMAMAGSRNKNLPRSFPKKTAFLQPSQSQIYKGPQLRQHEQQQHGSRRFRRYKKTRLLMETTGQTATATISSGGLISVEDYRIINAPITSTETTTSKARGLIPIEERRRKLTKKRRRRQAPTIQEQRQLLGGGFLSMVNIGAVLDTVGVTAENVIDIIKEAQPDDDDDDDHPGGGMMMSGSGMSSASKDDEGITNVIGEAKEALGNLDLHDWVDVGGAVYDGIKSIAPAIVGPPTTQAPTDQPSNQPTLAPTTLAPTQTPSNTPSNAPTIPPSSFPSLSPSISSAPSVSFAPSLAPSNVPSETPSNFASETPSNFPSETPSNFPSEAPSDVQSQAPSNFPSETPSNFPSETPSSFPSETPSNFPSEAPSISNQPTAQALVSNQQLQPETKGKKESSSVSQGLSESPSGTPSLTIQPSLEASQSPSYTPSLTIQPSMEANESPSYTPSLTIQPSMEASQSPSYTPSVSIHSSQKSSEKSDTPSVSIRPSQEPSEKSEMPFNTQEPGEILFDQQTKAAAATTAGSNVFIRPPLHMMRTKPKIDKSEEDKINYGTGSDFETSADYGTGAD
jgi:hypothetical protein